jgi:hypothetical protein
MRTCERELSVRENELNREKDDMDVCECREYDVAVFGGGKNFSLYFKF